MLPEEQPTMSFAAGEKRSIESEECPVNKRCRSSSSPTTNQWSLHSNKFPISLSDFNPNEPPLGLQLTKSPALLELIQERLLHDTKNNDALPHENLQAGSKKHVKEQVQASGPTDKLKASNFPGLLLRIGKWEYKSQHEGDLVAKCYFSKHKLVWEVLVGGLKNKIEMQWSQIKGLKANCPDNGPGTLTIWLENPPLFFKETNPQPKKHTLWQATSDFTNGEASIYRQHYLECPEGVLNKHYEKLIQCDTRLKALSQHPLANSNVSSVANDPNISNNANESGCSQPDPSKGFLISSINKTSTLDLVCGDFVKEYGFGKMPCLEGSETIGGQINTPRLQQSVSNLDVPCVANDPNLSNNANESGCSLPELSKGFSVSHINKTGTLHLVIEYGFATMPCLEWSETIVGQIYTQRFQQSMSNPDPVNHIRQHCVADLIPRYVFENTSMFDKLFQIVQNDTQMMIAASDERSLVSRFDSMCCLLGYPNPDCNPILPENGDHEVGLSRNDWFSDILNLLPGMPSNPSLPTGDEWENGDHEVGLSRNDWFSDILNLLPEMPSTPSLPTGDEWENGDHEVGLSRNDWFSDILNLLPEKPSNPSLPTGDEWENWDDEVGLSMKDSFSDILNLLPEMPSNPSLPTGDEWENWDDEVGLSMKDSFSDILNLLPGMPSNPSLPTGDEWENSDP